MTDNPLLEEYKLCHSMIRHLDEQNWSWGSFILGGSLAAARELWKIVDRGSTLLCAGQIEGWHEKQ